MDGDFIVGLIIIAVIGWLIYDNLIASHYSIIYTLRDGDGSAKFIYDEEYKTETDCISKSMYLNDRGGLLVYQCGYKCRLDGDSVYCDRWI